MTATLTSEQEARVDELLAQPCECLNLTHACERCKELARLMNAYEPDGSEESAEVSRR